MILTLLSNFWIVLFTLIATFGENNPFLLMLLMVQASSKRQTLFVYTHTNAWNLLINMLVMYTLIYFVCYFIVMQKEGNSIDVANFSFISYTVAWNKLYVQKLDFKEYECFETFKIYQILQSRNIDLTRIVNFNFAICDIYLQAMMQHIYQYKTIQTAWLQFLGCLFVT